MKKTFHTHKKNYHTWAERQWRFISKQHIILAVLKYNGTHWQDSVAELLAMQSAVIATAIPSVRPSVTRWYCTQMNEDKITRSSLWGSKNTLSFLIPTMVGGRRPLPRKICAQIDPPPSEKSRLRPIFAYNVSTVRAGEKVQLSRLGSQPRALKSICYP